MCANLILDLQSLACKFTESKSSLDWFLSSRKEFHGVSVSGPSCQRRYKYPPFKKLFTGIWLINNVVIVAGEQQKGPATHRNVFIPPQTPPTPGSGHHTRLKSFMRYIQQVLVGSPFQTQQCVHVIPKLSIVIPSPGNHKSVPRVSESLSAL